MSFNISDGRGRGLAEVELRRLAGRPGLGFYKLTSDWRFEVQASGVGGREQGSLDTFECEVLIANRPLGWMRAQPGQSRVETRGPAWKTQLTCELDLTPRQLEALENTRMGGDLQVQFTAAGSVSVAEIPGFPFRQTDAHTITQSDWVRILGEMNYRQSVLIELDTALPLSAEFANAVNSLRKAQQQILSGHIVDAVRECRVVLDRIDGALGDGAQAVNENRFQRTKHERYLEVRRAVFSLASPAHHGDASALTIEYHRSDALAILALVTGLVRALEGTAARGD